MVEVVVEKIVVSAWDRKCRCGHAYSWHPDGHNCLYQDQSGGDSCYCDQFEEALKPPPLSP